MNTLSLKTLYSESKKKKYSGAVYLADEGPASPYGASFMLQEIVSAPPEVLGKCPRCGKDVLEGKLGFGCSGYREGCKFVIWKKSKMKLLANVTFTKTDAKRFLAGKNVKKRRLVDRKGNEFTAELRMEEEADNPYGPVYRVVEGTEQYFKAPPEEKQPMEDPEQMSLAGVRKKKTIRRDKTSNNPKTE